MPEPMSARDLADAIREYVHSHDHVSFAELDRRFPDYFGSGDLQLSIPRNVVLWHGMTETAADAIDIVRNEFKEITLNPASLLVYLIDGKMLRMDIAKRPPRGGYAEPHWAPTVLALKSASR